MSMSVVLAPEMNGITCCGNLSYFPTKAKARIWTGTAVLFIVKRVSTDVQLYSVFQIKFWHFNSINSCKFDGSTLSRQLHHAHVYFIHRQIIIL